LANRHPFKVRTHRVHLTRIDADAAEFEERCFGVVHAAEAVSVAVVGDFVVVPGWDPCEVLVGKTEVQVGAVLADACSVVVEREDFAFGGGGARVFSSGSFACFVDVVAEVDLGSSTSWCC
jgi:hypothetical protein